MGVPDLFPTLFGSETGGYHPRPAGRYLSCMIERLPTAKSFALDANALVYLVLPYVLGNDDGTGTIADIVAEMSDEEIQLKIFEYLDMLILNIVAIVAPRYALIIAFDGVAPLGKIDQQKQRRYASKMKLPESELDSVENPAATFSKDKGFPRFNKDCITAGTQFMFDLDEHMRDFIAKNQYKLGVRKVIYSSHMEHGEGEHKIFDFYRKGIVTDDNDPIYDGVHVIYGMDADLIMISAISDMQNIILARDSIDVSFKDLANNVISIQQDRRPRKGKFGQSTHELDAKIPKNIDIEELRNLIIKDMGTEFDAAVPDFVLLVSLLGNDFLPHPIINQNVYSLLDIIIENYRKLGGRLTYKVDGTFLIDWGKLTEFYIMMGNEESSVLHEVSSQSRKYGSRFMDAAKAGGIFDYDRLRDAWYSNEAGLSQLPGFTGDNNGERIAWVESNTEIIRAKSQLQQLLLQAQSYDVPPAELSAEIARLSSLIGESGSESSGYNPMMPFSTGPTPSTFSAFGSNPSWMTIKPKVLNVEGSPEPMVVNMCYQFVRGMVWTLQYYYYGMKAMTWSWSYPYHHAPLMTDIADVMRQIISRANPQQMAETFNVTRIPGEVEFEAPHVLLSVLSPYSAYLAPLELQHYYWKNTLLFDQMPLNIAFEIDGIPTKKKLWKAIPLLPKVNYPLIMRAVKEANWSTQRWMLWKPIGYAVYELDKDDLLEYMKSERSRAFLETRNDYDRLRRAELAVNKGKFDKTEKRKPRGGPPNMVNRRTDSRSVMFSGAREAKASQAAAMGREEYNRVYSSMGPVGSSHQDGSDRRGGRGGYTRERGDSKSGGRGGYRGRRGDNKRGGRGDSKRGGRGGRASASPSSQDSSKYSDLSIWS